MLIHACMQYCNIYWIVLALIQIIIIWEAKTSKGPVTICLPYEEHGKSGMMWLLNNVNNTLQQKWYLNQKTVSIMDGYYESQKSCVLLSQTSTHHAWFLLASLSVVSTIFWYTSLENTYNAIYMYNSFCILVTKLNIE